MENGVLDGVPPRDMLAHLLLEAVRPPAPVSVLHRPHLFGCWLLIMLLMLDTRAAVDGRMLAGR